MGARKIAETATEFELISEVSRVISDVTGIQLGPKQASLVQSRLAKRLRELKITDPLEYARYYNNNETVEVGVLVSLLTTHHTYFFREFQHFEFLLQITLPKLIRQMREEGRNRIRIWSAACSRGHEVYSLSMFLRAHLPAIAPDMDFEVIGSDVCEESIAIAKNGVYGWEELRTIPSMYLQGNWVRGTGNIANFVRAKDVVRQGTSFRMINLQDLDKEPFGPTPEPFDIIFIRNVFIYFNHSQIRRISNEIFRLLSKRGQVFVGLSESLNGLSLPVEWVGPSVYELKHSNEKTAKVVPLRALENAAEAGQVAMAPAETQPFSSVLAHDIRKIRVLCVDDSPTVLLLLKRILIPAKGFEVVGTASDGIDATEKAKSLKPDIITLDIHMPRMTGVEFLERHAAELKAPVLIVSSVPRDDAALAYRCLELGAVDYIEKPSTQNLEKVEEELHFKLRVADETWRKANSGGGRSRALELEASFRRPPPILNPNGKLRVVICSFASRDVVSVLLRGFTGIQPGTLVLLDGGGDLLPEWIARESGKTAGGKGRPPGTLKEIVPGTVHYCEFHEGLRLLKEESGALVKSTMAIGPLSRAMVEGIKNLSIHHLILEDRGLENPRGLLTKVSMILPLTSFVYESNRYLAESDAQKSGGGR